MKPEKSPEKTGYFARRLAVARRIREEPRSAVGFFRSWFLKLWLARGGGYYGLGVVITFLIFEVRFFFSDLWNSDSVVGFMAQEVFEFILRIGYQSFVNLVQALIWPAFLLERFGAWGFALLIAGFFAFENVLRPVLEDRAPELREARLTKEQARRKKEEKKRLKKARKTRR